MGKRISQAFILLLILFSFIAGILVASSVLTRRLQAQDWDKIIFAKGFVMLDNNGKTRAEIRTADDTAIIRLLDSKGRTCAVMSANNNETMLSLASTKKTAGKQPFLILRVSGKGTIVEANGKVIWKE